MSKTNSLSLSQDLLDDFFAEADEHLHNLRRALLDLETSETEVCDPQLIGDLFHNFHSFKGISAIVGLGAAEALAHAAEDLLRLMRSGQVQLSGKSLDILNAVVHNLEQIVAAFRARKPLPDCAALLAEIKAKYPSSSLVTVRPMESDDAASGSLAGNVQKTDAQGLNVWKFTFAPTQELHAQKININTIRDRLAQVGEILKSTPVVKGKGVITFEFLIATNQSPQDDSTWADYGISVELVSEQNTAKPASSDAPPTTTENIHSPFLAPSHVVRVDLKRLDDLLRIVGEMVIHRSRLEIQLAQLNTNGADIDLRGIKEVNRMLGRSLRQMRQDLMRIRLIPISEIFARLPFVVSDLARESSKKVRLQLEGQETAIDKYLIEKLKDPLLHMVRNAFSHGIETVAERIAASKPEEATIKLSASAAGDWVIIKVADDGKGIAADAIFARAKKLGLKIPKMSQADGLLSILCSAGFSTRDDADRASGRGVGMAVVQTIIQELGGKLTVTSEPGRGTQFTLRLPLTVVIAEVLLVSAAGQTCAVPQSSVGEIFHATRSDIKIADGIEMVSYRGGVLPLTRLTGLFRLKSQDEGVSCVLVVTSERGSVGLLVEKVMGQREVVVRPFRDPLIQVSGIAGATELGDGKPVLILDGAALTAGKVRPADALKPTKK